MLDKLMKSIIEQDKAAVVICDLEHTIVYMNPSAKKNYEKWGDNLVGNNLMDCHNKKSQELIKKVTEWFALSEDNNMIHTFFNESQNKDGYTVALRDENNKLIGYYEKHEYRIEKLLNFTIFQNHYRKIS